MPDNPHLPALVAAYRRWAETRGANVEEILDMFADEIEMLSVPTDNVMIGRCAWRNRATGRVVDSPKIDVHSFNHAGKVFRFREVFDTLGFARALGIV